MERPGDSLQDVSATSGKCFAKHAERRSRTDDNRAQVLVISPRPQVRECMSAAVSEQGCGVRSVSNVSDARSLVRECAVDLALIDCALGPDAAFELSRECSNHEPGIVTILLCDRPNLEDAMRAMRSGAVDLIGSNVSSRELFERINSGLDRAQNLRQRERRALRLRGLCLRLNAARQEVSRHVGELCSDLVEAYQDLSSQIDHIGMSSELNCLLRQELDLEALLRTTLEYLLSKIGSTNAAIFLPSSSGEFSLGAYVNYDRSKDEAEVMLDHLASVLAPKFESHEHSVWMRDADETARWLDEESHWLEGCETLVVPCHEGGECLAVLSAFRSNRAPFSDSDRSVLETLGKLFGKQLARVIGVHHRHLPKDKWSELE
ncbi:MAG: response regulator [Planctomycetota bacterium]|nr:MAG: response regulator [Planctomycetota bacterium]